MPSRERLNWDSEIGQQPDRAGGSSPAQLRDDLFQLIKSKAIQKKVGCQKVIPRVQRPTQNITLQETNVRKRFRTFPFDATASYPQHITTGIDTVDIDFGVNAQ